MKRYWQVERIEWQGRQMERSTLGVVVGEHQPAAFKAALKQFDIQGQTEQRKIRVELLESTTTDVSYINAPKPRIA